MHFSSLGSVVNFPVCQIIFSVSIQVQKISYFANSNCNNNSDRKMLISRAIGDIFESQNSKFIFKLFLPQWSYLAAN